MEMTDVVYDDIDVESVVEYIKQEYDVFKFKKHFNDIFGTDDVSCIITFIYSLFRHHDYELTNELDDKLSELEDDDLITDFM